MIHSENAAATRLHPPLPPHQIEELQFHWEELKYEWDDLLEAYQERQLPEQSGNAGTSSALSASSSLLLYPVEEIERWKGYRETIVGRLGEIGALLAPASGAGSGGGGNANGSSGGATNNGGNAADRSSGGGGVGGGGDVVSVDAIGAVGDNITGGNVNSSGN